VIVWEEVSVSVLPVKGESLTRSINQSLFTKCRTDALTVMTELPDVVSG